MVQVWQNKSLFFCLTYDPLIIFRRQNHITFIFIKTISHDLLVQMAYCIKKPEKKIRDFNGVWTHDLAIPVWCFTNWAMKPLTLGTGQLWVHVFQWKKWVLMIYEINHIWTVEVKWKWRNDCCSECNLCKLRKEAWKKKFRTSTGFESVTSWFFRLLYAIV